MNLINKIGRYEIAITSILAIVEIDDGDFEVILPYNIRLNLNPEEKRQLDEARELHAQVMNIYGLAKGLGRAGM